VTVGEEFQLFPARTAIRSSADDPLPDDCAGVNLRHVEDDPALWLPVNQHGNAGLFNPVEGPSALPSICLLENLTARNNPSP
jgi:hypothetical protein